MTSTVIVLSLLLTITLISAYSLRCRVDIQKLRLQGMQTDVEFHKSMESIERQRAEMYREEGRESLTKASFFVGSKCGQWFREGYDAAIDTLNTQETEEALPKGSQVVVVAEEEAKQGPPENPFRDGSNSYKVFEVLKDGKPHTRSTVCEEALGNSWNHYLVDGIITHMRRSCNITRALSEGKFVYKFEGFRNAG